MLHHQGANRGNGRAGKRVACGIGQQLDIREKRHDKGHAGSDAKYPDWVRRETANLSKHRDSEQHSHDSQKDRRAGTHEWRKV